MLDLKMTKVSSRGQVHDLWIEPRVVGLAYEYKHQEREKVF